MLRAHLLCSGGMQRTDLLCSGRMLRTHLLCSGCSQLLRSLRLGECGGVRLCSQPTNFGSQMMGQIVVNLPRRLSAMISDAS